MRFEHQLRRFRHLVVRTRCAFSHRWFRPVSPGSFRYSTFMLKIRRFWQFLLALSIPLGIASACSPGCSRLVPEYLVVHFEPDEGFTSGGLCRSGDASDSLQPSDVGVLIEGKCHGNVGEPIPLTAGSFEVSVDVLGAETQVVMLQSTTPANPKVITVTISARD